MEKPTKLSTELEEAADAAQAAINKVTSKAIAFIRTMAPGFHMGNVETRFNWSNRHGMPEAVAGIHVSEEGLVSPVFEFVVGTAEDDEGSDYLLPEEEVQVWRQQDFVASCGQYELLELVRMLRDAKHHTLPTSHA